MITHRALIVEDDPSLAALMGRLLARVSVGSTAVGTVAAAEGALAEGHFDVIVLDPNLPDGDGLALLAGLRGRGVLTPAVIVSGSAVAPPDARCLALVKPFTKDALPDAVLTLLEPS
ncbi:MAG: response regulator [Polyangiales bacterium]